MYTERLDLHQIARAAHLLQNGQIVAFPTETVYGLGAGIFHPDAIEKIFIAKGRPADNPLIAHVSCLEQILLITRDLSPLFYKLYDAFFPGPLTVVLPKSDKVPSIASGGLNSIALRMSSYPLVTKLITLVGQPLVAPSANLSGKPSATHYSHVLHDFEGKIAAVITGDESEIGLESTVVSLLTPQPILLRPGAITKEQIEEVLATYVIDRTSEEVAAAPLSPGMKYRHYAPLAPIEIFTCKEECSRYLQRSQGKKKLILGYSETATEDDLYLPLDRKTLYKSLRQSDSFGFEQIIVLCDEHHQSDRALMNRLKKAAAKL